jgi:protein gp37
MTNTTTGIEWTDTTWNPVTGCTRVSAGCDHCYADTIATRFAGTPAFPNGFTPTLRPERLGDPLHWRQPRRVFVNSMSDLFHNAVPDTYIAEIFAVMAAAHRHTFQILTKRHGRMRALLSDPDFRQQVCAESATLAHEGIDTQPNNPWDHWPLPNVWLGVSTETQSWADIRIPALLATPAAVRFISAEPLLGSINLTNAACTGTLPTFTGTPVHSSSCCRHALNLIDWVITGGESGPAARPMHPGWARSLRNQCQRAHIPFFFKQWGTWAPFQPDHHPHPTRRVITTTGTSRPYNGPPIVGHDTVMGHYGKARAGRLLDGRTWDQYPTLRGGEPR